MRFDQLPVKKKTFDRVGLPLIIVQASDVSKLGFRRTFTTVLHGVEVEVAVLLNVGVVVAVAVLLNVGVVVAVLVGLGVNVCVPVVALVGVRVPVAVDGAGVIVRVTDGDGVRVLVCVAAGIGVCVGVNVLHCVDDGFSKFWFLETAGIITTVPLGIDAQAPGVPVTTGTAVKVAVLVAIGSL